MRTILVVAGLCLVAISTAGAQSAREKLQALEAGLNDTSAIIRLAALEEGLADESSAVRQYALSQALASGDGVMQSMGVTHFFTTKRNLSITVEKSDELLAAEQGAAAGASGVTASALDEFKRQNNRSYEVLNYYSPSLLYQIASFDPQSGSISGFCLNNLTKTDERYVFSGDVVGKKLNLIHACNAGHRNCSLELELLEAGRFAGSMRCTNEVYPASVSLAVN